MDEMFNTYEPLFAAGWFVLWLLTAWTNAALSFRSVGETPPVILMFAHAVFGGGAFAMCALTLYYMAGMLFFDTLFAHSYGEELFYGIVIVLCGIGAIVSGVFAPRTARRHRHNASKAYGEMALTTTA